jgi:hypothetical protein
MPRTLDQAIAHIRDVYLADPEGDFGEIDDNLMGVSRDPEEGPMMWLEGDFTADDLEAFAVWLRHR